MLTQKLILGYSTKMIVQFISVIAGIIVARIAGPTILGIVAFGMSFVSMFLFFADLGTGSAHIKLVSEGRELGDCIKTYTVIKSLLTVLFALIVISFLVVKIYILKIQFESSIYLSVIIIWLCTNIIGQFLYIPISTFIALTQQARQDIPNLIQTIATQALRIISVFLKPSAIYLSLANLAGTIIISPFYLRLFRTYPKGKFDKNLANDYLKIAKPMIVLHLYGFLTLYLDKVLLQYFSDSTQVGYYTAGFGIAGFMQAISLTTGPLFFPLFSSAVAQKDYQYVNQTIDKFEHFAFLFITPAIIYLMLNSKIIIKILLGNNYLASWVVLFWTLAGTFFIIINQHYGNLLVGANFFTECAYINLLGILSFVLLNIFFVSPKFLNLKAEGTAVAFAVNSLFIGILFRVFVSKLVKPVFPWRGGKYIIFILLNFFFFFGLSRYFAIETNLIRTLIFFFAYFGITYPIFYLTRLMSRQDLNRALRIFDISALLKYIRSEL
ncbi:MAG: oligosaccharide flippase family protein [candidate division WOR-3 bacterium]